MDRRAAAHIDSVAGMISGLDLSAVNEDGHKVANLLWKIAAFLRQRDT